MHTGGDPVRIVEKGYPEIKGATILEKIRYLKKELDHVRKLLMWEQHIQPFVQVAIQMYNFI
jgi:trans-L-3-hydroxyproline dehydratase